MQRHIYADYAHAVRYHMYIELMYPLQNGDTPLLLAARGVHPMCVEHLLSTPGIDVNVKDKASYGSGCE